MKLLQVMLEQMRGDGYVANVPFPKGVDGSPVNRWIEEMPSDDEWALFSEVEPFIFSSQDPFDHTDNARVSAQSYREGFDTTSEIDAPFPVFSIEYLDGAPLDFFLMKNGERRETMAILVIEIKPKQYGYYALCRDFGNPRKTLKVFKSNMEGETVERILQRLNTEKVGVEATRTMIKFGVGKAKIKRRIRKIVHVSPKKFMSSYQSMGHAIDWSHRWEVRGHWRHHVGLGKDREGNYCISGFTWVVHHEKGPEHLPLIKKTRLVENPV